MLKGVNIIVCCWSMGLKCNVALWSKRGERSKTILGKFRRWFSVNYILLIILVRGSICLNACLFVFGFEFGRW